MHFIQGHSRWYKANIIIHGISDKQFTSEMNNVHPTTRNTPVRSPTDRSFSIGCFVFLLFISLPLKVIVHTAVNDAAYTKVNVRFDSCKKN